MVRRAHRRRNAADATQSGVGGHAHERNALHAEIVTLFDALALEIFAYLERWQEARRSAVVAAVRAANRRDWDLDVIVPRRAGKLMATHRYLEMIRRMLIRLSPQKRAR